MRWDLPLGVTRDGTHRTVLVECECGRERRVWTSEVTRPPHTRLPVCVMCASGLSPAAWPINPRSVEMARFDPELSQWMRWRHVRCQLPMEHVAAVLGQEIALVASWFETHVQHLSFTPAGPPSPRPPAAHNALSRGERVHGFASCVISVTRPMNRRDPCDPSRGNHRVLEPDPANPRGDASEAAGAAQTEACACPSPEPVAPGSSALLAPPCSGRVRAGPTQLPKPVIWTGPTADDPGPD